MEKHKCKLCLRNFPNGRALGGHMRSHMVNIKPEEPSPPPLVQLSFEADESSPSSFSSEEEEDDEKALSYGLRENPKRSFRLVDPEFSFPIESNSVILQDRESETESSMNPTRARSKRVFKNINIQFHHHQHQKKKMKPNNHHHHHHRYHKNKIESSWIEPEPVSSISDGTTDEDVAFCLIMLSRDQWKRPEDEDEEEYEEEEEDERSMEDSDEFYEEIKSSKAKSVRGGRYKCETCNRVFRSYQALGGHRASHKKTKAAATCEPEIDNAPRNMAAVAEKKVHECPVCLRVFASGQALGGHKRTHVTGASATSSVVVRSSNTPSTVTKFGDNNNNKNNSLIDLNLPAPVDEDEISQIENSAVSDAEFLNPSSQSIGAQV